MHPGTFFRRQDGATAIEFAFVAPVLALILSGIVELSMIMYTTAVMEGATTISSRLGKTGFSTTSESRQDMIYDMIRDQCGALIDMSKVTITTLSYGSFDNVGKPEPYTDSNHNGHYDIGEPYTDVNGNGEWDADMGASGVGGADDVVLYRVTYPWPILTPLMSIFFTNGAYTITSSVLVKNEPYDTE
jgi:hypothetical protein